MVVNQRRLRIVDDRDVPTALEAHGVQQVVAVIDLALLVRERLRVPLEGVVNQLRDVEKFLPTKDHLPVHVELEVAHQREEGIEDL